MRWDVNINTDALPQVRRGAERGLFLALHNILNVSNERVPLEEATLQRSGAVDVRGLSGVVSYDTPYAVIQHENMTYRHDAGRQAKYLETAMMDERRKTLQVIAAQIRRATGS